MTTAAEAELPVLERESADAWDGWLREHGTSAAEVDTFVGMLARGERIHS